MFIMYSRNQKLNEVFKEYRPDIVYHATAHRHVPLMGDSPMEDKILLSWIAAAHIAVFIIKANLTEAFQSSTKIYGLNPQSSDILNP